MIRMKFSDADAIKNLIFDIPQRQLTVIHIGAVEPVASALKELNLGSSLLITEEANPNELPVDVPNDRKLLAIVLAINAFFFIIEVIAGVVANSMGLVADSLDMLADALVYGMSLYAVGRAITTQKKVARISGYFQLALAIGGLTEVLRRFFTGEQEPDFQLMMGISFLALMGNTASLILLQRSRSQEAHMQASQIFTSNDVIANIGVIVAGALVFISQSALPDLIIGLIVFGLVARGAIRIFSLSK